MYEQPETDRDVVDHLHPRLQRLHPPHYWYSPGYSSGRDAAAYYAYDLRKAFGGWVRTFNIRVYVIGAIPCDKDDPEAAEARDRGERRVDEVENPNDSDSATMIAAGDKILLTPGDCTYTVLEYMRAEAE